MYRSAYTINLTLEGEEKEFNLRLPVSAQLELKRKHGAEGLSLILKAVDDLELQTDIITRSLSYKGNENSIKSGQEFYEALVDNGYKGTQKFASLIFEIAAASGVITDEQKIKLSETISDTFDKVFDSINEVTTNAVDKKLDEIGSDTDSSFRK